LALPLTIKTDIKGNARFNDTVDMGAFEFGRLNLSLDTDGDGMPDWWEFRFGLAPDDANDAQLDLDGDVIDVNGGYNIYADSDDDGLDTLQEVVFETHPFVADSDGDGVSDGDEVSQGSLPMDASDLGLPPSADEVCELRLTVGDWSNSNSERYDLVVGPITHQATRFGVVETKDYKQFRAGKRYEVQIIHRGTDPSKWWFPANVKEILDTAVVFL